jgi:hypothetical protein
MMSYYPARDGHPSMFAPEDNAWNGQETTGSPRPKANEFATDAASLIKALARTASARSGGSLH